MTIVTPIKRKQVPKIINTDTKSDTYQPSDWTIHDRDIIYVAQLPSKYTDICKKPFEIRCSAIRFGITEFTVDSEVVVMHETEFEMKLTGKNTI